MSVHTGVINIQKDYNDKGQSLFLGEDRGLFDSIHKKHEDIFKLYKELKSLDWSEDEFDYSVCNAEFKSVDPKIKDIMIRTLAWQWEADSVVANSVITIGAPFISSDELAALWTEITKNEILHALTYSEIVKNSFDDPDEVLKYVVSNDQIFGRVESVANSLSEAYIVSHKLALGLIDKSSDEAYDAVFMMVVTLLALERLQFMASFAITFALADTGYFLPIGKAVQKICTDEFQIHVAADKAIIKNELNTERGKKAYTRLIPKIKKVLDDCVNSEVKWTTYLFSEFNEGQEESSSELAGVTEEMVKQWIYYSALDVYVTLKIPFDYPVYKTNPLKYMERWIDINNNQASAQEEKTGNYLLGGFIDDLSNDIIDVDL